jgi:hypothetical protein
MTLQDAKTIVQEYGSLLAKDSATAGPASYASRLPHSPERIVEAMKLWLAHHIQNRSLTQEFRDEIGTAASRLPYFIEDEEARPLNTTNRTLSPVEDVPTLRQKISLRTRGQSERCTSGRQRLELPVHCCVVT